MTIPRSEAERRDFEHRAAVLIQVFGRTSSERQDRQRLRRQQGLFRDVAVQRVAVKVGEDIPGDESAPVICKRDRGAAPVFCLNLALNPASVVSVHAEIRRI